MAYESNLTLESFEAGQTFASKQYYCVNLASDGQIDPASAGAVVTGVIQDTPTAAGRAAGVAIAGITKVAASATADPAIAIGSALVSSSVGEAIAASTGGTAYVWGRALQAMSTGNSGIISALITHEGPTSTA